MIPDICGCIFGLYIPTFGLNTEIYSVNHCVQSKYEKIRTGKNSVFWHFSRSANSQKSVCFHKFWKVFKKKIANFCSAYSANVQSYFIMFKNRRLVKTIWIDNHLQWTRTVETQNVLRCESINQIKKKSLITLSEKFPYSEFILVRIFPHSDWIRRETEYLSVFSPNVGKYGPE